MKSRKLGMLEVSALGLGCMPMSSVYGTANPAEAVATLEAAVELGVTFWDTAEIYGEGGNEELIGPVLKRHRDRVTIATKFGFTASRQVAAGPENARGAIDGSLRRLQTDHIDLWYAHRVDPTVPIEETIGAMSEIVASGKVRYIGLSEASAASLHRACAVHPITALQSEWSLWARDIEAEVLPVARELGIGIVPYSPLGRGILTGTLTSLEDLAANDLRRKGPRFGEENFEHNRALVEVLSSRADDLECTPAQLALAWVLAQGDDVVPIPGTRSEWHLIENAEAVAIELPDDLVEELGAIFQDVAGARYSQPHAYGDSPLPAENA